MQAKHRGNVVVVEDDHSLSQAIRRLLESTGFRTRVCESAEALLVDEAVQLADCFVIDIQLPGMSGLELYRELSEAGSSTPVIIITAHDDPVTRQAATQAGAAAYLTKPFSNQSLIGAVAGAIAGRPSAPKTS